ncbi:MAG: hypothetical protein ACOYJD_04660 [Christensenellales bacterium]
MSQKMSIKAIRVIIALVISAAIFAIGMFVGKLASNNTTHNAKPQLSLGIEEGREVLSESDDNTLSPNARVIWEYTYTDCGHAYKEEKPVEAAIIGMGAEDVAGYYSEFELISFKRELVVMKAELGQVCPRHILVRLHDGGRAGIYRNLPGTDEMQLENTVSLDMQRISEEQKVELEEGIVFDDTEQMEAFFEDIGS